MNKIIIKLFSLFFIIFLSLGNTSAIKIEIRPNSEYQNLQIFEENLTIERTFSFLASFHKKTTPQSYKYIQLNFKSVKKGSFLEDALKILIYNDKIKNSTYNLHSEKPVNAYHFYKLAEKTLGVDISGMNKKSALKRNTNTYDLTFIKKAYRKKQALKTNIIQKNALFKDIYKTITSEHYNKDNIKDTDLIYAALEGLAKGTKDKHTIYFPPVKNKSFKAYLDGDFEGIGAYVDLKEPGNFVIVSPISDSPAEKAGLKGGDRIIKVGDNKVTPEHSSEEIISWIKGKSGTTVNLTILRGKTTIEIKVIRAKIHISNVEYKILDNKAHYIELKNFGNQAEEEFKEILKNINKNKGINKIIIDLRNNGGGYLSEVTKMLSHMIPEGEKTAVIKYTTTEKIFTSLGHNTLDLHKYKVVILQNSGTASASEILIGSIKDYFPDTIIIGEQSYGKGSVQTIKSYYDGSSLKYTVAKWFTGKTETGIDGKGITPDILLEFNDKRYKENNLDNQLEKALSI